MGNIHVPYSCSICKIPYFCSSNLDKHFLKNHSGQEKSVQCDKCGSSFWTKDDLHQHVQTVHEKKFKHQCQYCLLGHYSLAQLKRHEMVHTGEKPFPCDICKRMFRSKYDVSAHKLSKHADEEDKVFQCKQCDKKFARSILLKSHQTVHADVKKFACSVCDYRSHRATDLEVHMITHSDDRPHACEICGKAFKRAKHVKRHMSVHRK